MKWSLSALAIAILLTYSLHATNGMSPIGYGVKSKGMGGVGVALPQDTFVVATNPAGLVDLGCSVDIELSYTFQDAFVTTTRTASLPGFQTVDAKSTRGLWWPAIGASMMLNECMSIGIAAYTLGASDMAWDKSLGILQAVAPSDPTNRTQMQNYYIAITPGFAWRVCSNHAFGISASIVIGTAEANGISRIELRSQLPAFVDGNGVDIANGVNVRIGWLGDFFCKRLRVGASIVSKTYMSRFTKYQGLIGDYGAFQWPWSGILGFSWRFTPCWVLSVDYRHIQWKSNDGMYFSYYVNQLNRGSRTQGMWDGQGFGWNNQGVVKVGLAWSPLGCLILRAGYNYGTAVIPSSELLLAPLMGAVIKNHVTAGITYTSCLGELSGYYAHGFRRTLTSHGGLEQGGTDEFSSLRNRQNELGLAWGRCF